MRADDLSNPSPFSSCNEFEMAATSLKCIPVLMELHLDASAPAVQGKYVPGGTPNANEEKGKEEETLVGRERGPASLALF